MKFSVDIIQISPMQNENLNFETIIFRIHVSGSIDINESHDLWALMNTMIEGGVRKVIIDMANLDFIDSSGIGVFVNSTKLLRTKCGDLIFLNVANEIKKIFKVVNLQDFIKVYNLEGEAINFFRYI
jgi:anti-sigma B factor antagonist